MRKPTVQVTSMPSVTAGSMTTYCFWKYLECFVNLTWLSCLKAKSTASLISFLEFTLMSIWVSNHIWGKINKTPHCDPVLAPAKMGLIEPKQCFWERNQNQGSNVFSCLKNKKKTTTTVVSMIIIRFNIN